MTPFEQAGYTKDSKFRTLTEIYGLPIGTTLILSKDDGTDSPFFRLLDGGKIDRKYNEVAIVFAKDVEIVTEGTRYPNPPHKHAALIKAWADGAVIEYCLEEGGVWISTNSPTWSERTSYRVKAVKSKKELEIEEWECKRRILNSQIIPMWEDFSRVQSQLLDTIDHLQELKSSV